MEQTRYNFEEIEAKWQAYWKENETFRTLDPGDTNFDPSRPKFYVLDMFPYPSGAGLHVGHPLGYIGTDIVARYKRMTGHNVLHPMGFDAFGLPAEQYAIEHGIHPRETTERNIENMRRQLLAFGLSYDWSREVQTIDPAYYKWTQWIFRLLRESYFDDESEQARPIADLVAKLDTGELSLDETGHISPSSPSADRWSSLDEEEQERRLEQVRLAFAAEVPVNWCPALGTALANEEVTNEGRSERGNHPVYKRPLRQWMLRITKYAERLAGELDDVDWPEPIKLMQRNWIGRSEGASVQFQVAGRDATIEVFTTRADTLFGATYMVLAPEHPLVPLIATDEHRAAVDEYRTQAERRSDVDRQADAKTKTGVFTGAYAINPVNGGKIPIWIADYVLMGYGTGAIMAVPAHDARDFEFAKQFNLPIVAVVDPPKRWIKERAEASGDLDAFLPLEKLQEIYRNAPDTFGEAFGGEGVNINSSGDGVSIDRLSTADAKTKITAWLEEQSLGLAKVQYKLRDWLFSRQRYWGEPIPVLYDEQGRSRTVDEDALPVELPPMRDFRPPTSDDPDVPPQPSLARAPKEWLEPKIDGDLYRRELNTMPQWAGSCWYYLRYLDPHNSERMVDPEKERYWMGENGVDLYVGGAEHAVLHLLYARFWHKVLFDLGHVSTAEPFGRLFNQGYILAYAYQNAKGTYVPAEEITEKNGKYFYQGEAVSRSQGKMGKSLKNAVNPDDMFHQYGCDTLRLYEMYMGPLETSKPWNTRDIVGSHRFLQRIWRNFINGQTGQWQVADEPADDETRRLLHKTIKRVTEDMERLRFNTAIAALIELNNALVPLETIPAEVARPFVLMLSPFCPHIAEELWHRLNNETSIAYEPWPTFDPAQLVQNTMNIVIQILGKTRGQVEVAADAGETEIQEAAMADGKIAKHLEGKTVRKVVYVPGRLLNIVAN